MQTDRFPELQNELFLHAVTIKDDNLTNFQNFSERLKGISETREFPEFVRSVSVLFNDNNYIDKIDENFSEFNGLGYITTFNTGCERESFMLRVARNLSDLYYFAATNVKDNENFKMFFPKPLPEKECIPPKNDHLVVVANKTGNGEYSCSIKFDGETLATVNVWDLEDIASLIREINGL